MIDIAELKNRYVAMNGARPIPSNVLTAITSDLGLQLPLDFLEIGKVFDGSGINVISLHSLAGNAPTMNPIHETLRLRKAIGLPSNWLVLGEPPESLLLMDCTADGQVIWIDAIDAKRIASQSFSTQPTGWNSFGEFFEYLLDEEEADR
ncbi:MAG TPA: SMI1/KNR4 family protein [Duganella sp.]|nr:SMI1/KNR4 family protein [Duganella sp.]